MAYCSSCGSQLSEGARFCANCGASVGGGVAPDTSPTSRVAESSRRPDPASTPTKSGVGGAGLILPIVVVVAALVIAFVLWSQRNGARPIAGESAAARETATRNVVTPAAQPAPNDQEPAPIEDGTGTTTSTTAAALDTAFFNDPVTAAARYDGPVRVSGTIATMVTPGPTPALSLEGRSPFNYMVVNFPRGYREQLAPLSKGQRITVACDRVSSLGGTTILQGCALR